MKGVTESMAGRAAILNLLPFSVGEQPKVSVLRGGFPEVLARPSARALWFRSYIQTYLERDVRRIGALRRCRELTHCCSAQSDQVRHASLICVGRLRSEAARVGWSRRSGVCPLWGARGGRGVGRSAGAPGEVLSGAIEGALRIACGIGPATGSRAIDESLVEQVRVVLLFEAGADPRPVLTRWCRVPQTVCVAGARGGWPLKRVGRPVIDDRPRASPADGGPDVHPAAAALPVLETGQPPEVLAQDRAGSALSLATQARCARCRSSSGRARSQRIHT